MIPSALTLIVASSGRSFVELPFPREERDLLTQIGLQWVRPYKWPSTILQIYQSGNAQMFLNASTGAYHYFTNLCSSSRPACIPPRYWILIASKLTLFVSVREREEGGRASLSISPPQRRIIISFKQLVLSSRAKKGPSHFRFFAPPRRT